MKRKNVLRYKAETIQASVQQYDLAYAVRQALRKPVAHSLGVGLLSVALAGGVPAVAADVFPAQIDLSSLATGDGSTGFRLNGVNVNGSAGNPVSYAGDVNGDGIDDVVIGAYRSNRSYVVFGRDAGFPAELDLAGLATGDGSTGFVVKGVNFGYRSGFSASGGGDINGDGIDDILIGAPYAVPKQGSSQYHAGESYVVFGRDTGFPAEFELSSLATGNGSTGFAINGVDFNDGSGHSVDAAGDVNGDGMNDIIIGVPGATPGTFQGDPPERPRAGETYIVFGRDTGFPAEFELSSIPAGNGTTGFLLNGVNASDNSGVSVSSAGDINSNGFDDLIIGSLTGASYVVFGRDVGFPSDSELSTLAPGNGLFGFAFSGDGRDISVSSAGDINGDGLDDFVVGSEYADPSGLTNAGQTYVVFGSAAGFPGDFQQLSLLSGDGSVGFAINGVDAFDRSGSSVDSAGDVNGDGIDDLLIGARLADQGYVLFGRNTGFPVEFELSSLLAGNGSEGFVLNGTGTFTSPGRHVSAAGDLNNDGVDDVIVSNRVDSYVVFGRAPAPDTDEDGVTDLNDNCTLVANGDQRDTDGDGYGNVCDPDLNNDGVVNFSDVALWVPFFNTMNDGDADFNGDGIVNFSDYALIPQYFLQAPGPSGVAAQLSENPEKTK